MAEHRSPKPGVGGSNPSTPAKFWRFSRCMSVLKVDTSENTLIRQGWAIRGVCAAFFADLAAIFAPFSGAVRFHERSKGFRCGRIQFKSAEQSAAETVTG